VPAGDGAISHLSFRGYPANRHRRTRKHLTESKLLVRFAAASADQDDSPERERLNEIVRVRAAMSASGNQRLFHIILLEPKSTVLLPSM